jgi:hypothetical protein
MAMLRRVDLEDGAAGVASQSAASVSEAVVPAVAEADFDTSLLPREHPRWVRDAVAVSARARELIARLRPVAIRVLCFWDHRLRSIAIGDRRVCVDASGCYRADA